ncbi:EAL domain-containing protein [Longimicrobium terrae]|uniref:EAL domain-containing protein (Putative c-di-GMP-specific phosphodiesterase class I) n=1 Tax=Longimicrobium terrae TaxID=1639882 RepID=A0A841H172_9BACT|nr:EAL domain-containing protein (putative c-di-GMP-specific phosphodiesterase class I)/GGDEF domain-containing protein [Longimicrobium terrae]MBB6071732.1 EAL domain-containing protein (putative c-di-GMP-specific phosphodiesterase class I) [Longimicrobium terrae]NNC28493.1 EAL domain-containing protein [Longimicrobium terrae]
MRVLGYAEDQALRDALETAARRLGAELNLLTPVEGSAARDDIFFDALRTHPDVAVVRYRRGLLERAYDEAQTRGIALVVACGSEEEARRAVAEGAEEWMILPVDEVEVGARVLAAMERARRRVRPGQASHSAEHLRYEELLYDRFTGFPTLPVMIERGREMLERRGRLTILYIEFVRYSKLEEIYGWEKLDEVLQTTAASVRAFYEDYEAGDSVMMVSHTADDDFIFFTDLPDGMDDAERRVNEMTHALENHVRTRLESEHGEDIAGLFEIYVGSSTIFRNPKIRTERIIYRGIREAAHAARSVENRERSRKVADLKTTLREGAVYIVYHPIVVTETREVFGYEALARGSHRALRSPEVLFGVAEEANLIWELSRLCRRRAIEGMDTHLKPGQLLFINIDPHDFRDPTFRYLDLDELGVEHPERIVLEITERTAITDYPTFQGYLEEFRKAGFRFAVDDAGSGYAGLGSIANLEPDFIKLDISLISGIDANFMKQNLVETMVQFANDHGIKVIAEGVEREEEWETVRRLGVHYTQGFLFHDANTNRVPVQAEP